MLSVEIQRRPELASWVLNQALLLPNALRFAEHSLCTQPWAKCGAGILSFHLLSIPVRYVVIGGLEMFRNLPRVVRWLSMVLVQRFSTRYV